MLISKAVYPILRNQRLTVSEYKFLGYQVLKRYKSSKKEALTTSTRSEVDPNVIPLGEKVKETTKTASYLGIILLGVGVTGTLFYAVFNELFSSKSPNNVYAKATKKCIADQRVEDKLGYPITAYGEETRRGRRQHVTHLTYEKDGKQYLRMRFYLKGTFHKGVVNLEMMENDSGKYEYRYLFVDVDDLARTTLVLEDNRHKQSLPSSLPNTIY